VDAFSQFRVTRDSDLDVDEDEVTNLRQALRTGLSHAPLRPGDPAGGDADLPGATCRSCCWRSSAWAKTLYRVNGPVNLVRLTS
jgi:polyphosphate kinase